MKKILALTSFVAVATVSGMATAATSTGTLNVDATVVGSCSVEGTTAINFGNYDPTSATPTDSAGDVQVRCTKNTAYTVYIGADRSMTDGTDTLNYELYSDAGRSSAWGDTLGTGVGYTAPDNNTAAHTIYGRVSALQNVGVGTYTDTVTVTVEY